MLACHLFGQLAFKLLDDLSGIGRRTARASADHNMRTNQIHVVFLLFVGAGSALSADGVFFDRPAVDDVIVDNARDLFRGHVHIAHGAVKIAPGGQLEIARNGKAQGFALGVEPGGDPGF